VVRRGECHAVPQAVLHQRGEAFDPVAVVAVAHAADVADLRLVDVAAHHAVEAASARLVREPAGALHHRVEEVAVDDVADEVELAALGVAQDAQQRRRLAARRAEVDVGDEDRAEAQPRLGVFFLDLRDFTRDGSVHSQPIVVARQVMRVSAP
jgi:hypothetical protein